MVATVKSLKQQGRGTREIILDLLYGYEERGLPNNGVGMKRRLG